MLGMGTRDGWSEGRPQFVLCRVGITNMGQADDRTSALEAFAWLHAHISTQHVHLLGVLLLLFSCCRSHSTEGYRCPH
jgi:hypothetical protein